MREDVMREDVMREDVMRERQLIGILTLHVSLIMSSGDKGHPEGTVSTAPETATNLDFPSAPAG
jgi:hypothetical protein